MSLIQVSTLTHDYVIDLLVINDNKFVGKTFGEQVLANPEIIKVFHGCSNDMAWVMRDLGVRIVNVFDTQDIYQQIGGKALALNHLWEKFCGYSMDALVKKQFQQSLWSQRPLSPEMLAYAAADSRYLIYLRYTLLMLALQGPSERLKRADENLNAKLSLKQLSKVYLKMQKQGVSVKAANVACEEVLKKFVKGDGKQLKYESIYKFKLMFDFLHEYCKQHDLNPEYFLDYETMHKLTYNSLGTSVEMKRTVEREENKQIKHHRIAITEEILRRAMMQVSEEECKSSE